MSEIPKRFTRFQEEFPVVAKAYEQLGDAVHGAGPLDDKTRALIKLALSTGARLEGAVHSHARKAVAAGLTREELRHTVMLSLPTIGFPSMMAALSWVDDIFEKDGG
jgi:AhpD family alkylhydroperoxidase